tara:strand:- start:2640 stop:3203 length:564 start_codon:yes stop_codon:yes gene_type:complete
MSIQKLIGKFNNSKGAKFVSFTYTNKFGEKAKRLIQINTIYENALKSDLEIVPNVEYVQNDNYDRATFITAQAELIKSAKMSLGINDDTMNKGDKSSHKNRSEGQVNAYVKIAKNIKYNVEKQQLHIFAKEVRKTILEEGVYPATNKRAKTKAKDYIKKTMKSSKYRNFIITSVETVKLNGDTIEIG